jgi:hypothetical protein
MLPSQYFQQTLMKSNKLKKRIYNANGQMKTSYSVAFTKKDTSYLMKYVKQLTGRDIRYIFTQQRRPRTQSKI